MPFVPRGAGCSNSRPPPPPPKVFEPVFLQIEILGKWVAPQAPKNFFGHALCTKITQPPYVCILKLFRSHWEFLECGSIAYPMGCCPICQGLCCYQRR